MVALRPVRSALCAVLLLYAGLFFGGCVERKLLIRSEPPGGVVLLDNKVVGITPTSVPFTFYGTRRVEVRWDPYLESMSRFKTVEETRTLYPPWYQVFPLDFLTEFVWPFTVVDERVFQFALQPEPAQSPEQEERHLDQLLRRADSMRVNALRDDEEDP